MRTRQDIFAPVWPYRVLRHLPVSWQLRYLDWRIEKVTRTEILPLGKGLAGLKRGFLLLPGTPAELVIWIPIMARILDRKPDLALCALGPREVVQIFSGFIERADCHAWTSETAPYGSSEFSFLQTVLRGFYPQFAVCLQWEPGILGEYLLRTSGATVRVGIKEGGVFNVSFPLSPTGNLAKRYFSLAEYWTGKRLRKIGAKPRIAPSPDSMTTAELAWKQSGLVPASTLLFVFRPGGRRSQSQVRILETLRGLDWRADWKGLDIAAACITDGGEEQPALPGVPILSLVSLGEGMAAVLQAAAVVGLHSPLLQLAVIMGRPTLGFFEASDSRFDQSWLYRNLTIRWQGPSGDWDLREPNGAGGTMVDANVINSD